MPSAVDSRTSRLAIQTRGTAWQGATAKTNAPMTATRAENARRKSACTASAAAAHQTKEWTCCSTVSPPKTRLSSHTRALESGRKKRTTRLGRVHQGMIPCSRSWLRFASLMKS